MKQTFQITGVQGYSSGFPHSYQRSIWVLIILVLAIALFNIAGWLFNIGVIESMKPRWVSLEIVSAFLLVFAATAFIFIQMKFHSNFIRIIPGFLSVIIFLISLLTLYVSFYSGRKGHEAPLTEISWLAIIIAPETRMASLVAFNFILIGCVLLLFMVGKNVATGITHALIIPVALISYFIPVSYIIGVYPPGDVHQIPIALDLDIAFCLFCAAVLLSRPDTWLLKVFTSGETGSIFFRKLLPALVAIPVVIGWLRLNGERRGIFPSDEGVALVAITYTTSFLMIIWMAARSVNQIDRKRFAADEALKKAYGELDLRVKERTEELVKMNRMLDAEIIERNKTQVILMAEQKRFNDLVELLPAYLILLTPDYHVSFANRFFRERFGDNRLMKRCFEYLFNRTEACEVCETYQTLKENKPQTWEWKGPDGHFYSIFDFPFTDTDGSRLIMEVGIDVTELKNAEAKLRNINAELEERVNARTVELMKSEQRYRSLFENMVEGFAFHEIILDKNGEPCDYRFLDINPAFEKQTGLKAENVIGKRVTEILPDIEKYWIEIYGKVALTGESIDFENYSSNLHKYFRISAFCPVKGYFAVNFDNITDRVLAEKELQSTKNYLENLINYANAPIIVWNTGTEILLFNHAFEHLTGYSSDEVLGKKLHFLFPEHSLKESIEKIERALTKNWETIEIPILTKDKRIRTVLWNSANIYDADGKSVLAIIAQGNDITGRIKAEKELLESKAKLDMALENANVGIWDWDLGTGRFEWDERMGIMLDLDSDQESKNYNKFEEIILEEDIPHFRKAVSDLLDKDIPLDTVFRIPGKNGDVNHISMKALVVKDNDGKPLKMTGACFDITGLKKGAEQTIFRLNDDLLRSNKELEQFAYVASHDLQEPLRMVSSFTQLLSIRYKDKLDSEAQEFINFAVDGASRMQALINDLLEYSRVETRGKNLTVTDMQSILGQVIHNLSIHIKEKNALVTIDKLPAIYADGGQMVQLFQNLISNALKFCETTPRIHVSAKEVQDHFLFTVRDNGIGIEPQYFDRIFQIFQRLHSKDEFGGTGIGLAICRRIVERHGGKIWVESTPGEGTVFNFTLKKR